MDNTSGEIVKGTTLFTSKPFAYVLCNVNNQLRCAYCFASQENLSRCSGCKFSHYCDKKCQKLAWQYHKIECSGLKRVHPKTPPDFVRLMVRVLCRLKKDGRNSKEIVGNTTRQFDSLISHLKEIKNDAQRITEFTVFNQILKEFLGEEYVLPTTELLEIFGKVIINCFSICDDEMVPIGTGLYLGASGLDHSCKPNAVVVFEGTTAIVRAVEDILSLDLNNIFISYIDVLDTTAERQAQLQKQYYFQCSCLICQDEALDLLKTSIKCENTSCKEPQLISQTGNCLNSECSACHRPSPSNQIVAEALKVMKLIPKSLEEMKKCQNVNENSLTCESLLQSSSLLHNYNVFLIRLQDQTMEAYIKDNNWKAAAEIGSETLDGYRLYYGKVHPLFGIQLVRLGKLFNCLDNIQLARRYLKEAEAVLSITYSKVHPMYKYLIMLMIENKF